MFEKMSSVYEIVAFELFAGISVIYDENTSDRESTSYQTALRYRIWLRGMFCNSICPRLMDNWDKSASVQLSAVFGTREHVGSGRLF